MISSLEETALALSNNFLYIALKLGSFACKSVKATLPKSDPKTPLPLCTKLEMVSVEKIFLLKFSKEDINIQFGIVIIPFEEPIFEKTFYKTSYACRKDKGTHKGVNNLQSTIRRYKKQNKECYFLKTDFSKYFYSIGSKLLKSKISKKITDRKTLRLLFQIGRASCRERVSSPV